MGVDGFTEADLIVDASGLNCPMPLLKAKQGLGQLQEGQLLMVIATDQGSKRDFDSFINLSTHAMLACRADNDKFIYLIKKGNS